VLLRAQELLDKVVDVVVKTCPFERKIGNAILKGAKK
jgi:hypothetical protein